MACEDRQLTEAQRQEGFQQQRTGVPIAVRPFTGRPTLDNLIDYINRELQPAIRQTRNAVNDVYLQVADNAPSANPLGYYFSVVTAAADPTTGRAALNASPQNTATVLRISQTNGRLVDVLPWLDVMNGSVTEPLGVVTLADAVNPGRFIRADLDTMTDQGAYWDLGITVTEASHPDPFVDAEGVTLAFIPGVADNEGLGAQIPPGSITPIAADTFLGNITGAPANPVAVPLASVDSTSIPYDATSHTFQRAALTGAIASALNSNATVFAGIRDNGSAENDRSNLNFLSSNDITFTVTDDSGNDELEVTATFAPTVVTDETVGGTFTDYALPADTDVWNFTATSTISSVTGGTAGRRLVITNGAAAGSGVTVTVQQFSGGTAANRFLLTKSTTHVLHPGDSLEALYRSSRWWQVDANRALYRTNSSGLGTSRGRVNYVDSTSITYSNTDVAADDEVTISPRRAALTGAIAAAANANTTTFAGILDNGSAENDRTSLNILSTTSVVAAVTDDSGNDELELTWQRAALTGFAEAAQNSNATTSAEPIVTYSASANMSAERVTTSSTSVTVSTSVASQIEFQRAALTGDVTATANSNATTIANDAVTNAKLADMAQSTIKGRAESAGTGDPTDLTPTQVASIIDGEAITWTALQSFSGGIAYSGTIQTETAAATMDITLAAGTVRLLIESSGSAFTVNSISGAATAGRMILLEHTRLSGSAVGTVAHASGTAPANSSINCPDSANHSLGQRHAAILVSRSGSWRIVGTAGIADGAITTVKLLDASVTLAKMANLAAGTVIGRQIDAGTGVPVALVGTELAEIIRWGNVTTEAVGGTFTDHALDMLTDVWIFTATSTVTGIAGGTSGKFLRIYNGAAAGSGVTVTLVQFATSLSGNRLLNRDAANIVLDPGNSATYYYESSRWRNHGVAGASAISDSDKGDVTVSASGKTWTVDNSAITLAKMANLAQSTIVGRAEGAGTGVPTALTPTQVVAIIDGENATWTGAHSFTGATHTVDVTGAISMESDADVGLASVSGGLALGAGHVVVSPNVDNGDVVINATGGIGINSHATTPVTGVATGTIAVTAAGAINLDSATSISIDADNDLHVTVLDEMNFTADGDITFNSGEGFVVVDSDGASDGGVVKIVARGTGATPAVTGSCVELWTMVPATPSGASAWLIATDENGYNNNMTVACASHMTAPVTVNATTTQTTIVTMSTPSDLEEGMCWHLHAAATASRGSTATAVGFSLSAYVNSTARFTVASALNTTNGYTGTATIDVYLTVVNISGGTVTFTVVGVGVNTITNSAATAETDVATFTEATGANGFSARCAFSTNIVGTSYTTVQGSIVRIR